MGEGGDAGTGGSGEAGTSGGDVCEATHALQKNSTSIASRINFL